MANPGLDEATRVGLVDRLMAARRAVREAKKATDCEAEAAAHRAVEEVKRALGERGPVWRDDGSPDLNRHMAKNTPYADWFARLAGCNFRVPVEALSKALCRILMFVLLARS
jgi:hypothetical protein